MTHRFKQGFYGTIKVVLKVIIFKLSFSSLLQLLKTLSKWLKSWHLANFFLHQRLFHKMQKRRSFHAWSGMKYVRKQLLWYYLCECLKQHWQPWHSRIFSILTLHIQEVHCNMLIQELLSAELKCISVESSACFSNFEFQMWFKTSLFFVFHVEMYIESGVHSGLKIKQKVSFYNICKKNQHWLDWQRRWWMDCIYVCLRIWSTRCCHQIPSRLAR